MSAYRPLVVAVLAGALTVPAAAIIDAPEASPAQGFGFIVDPGHGGEDLGAVVKGAREKDIALSIALKLKDKLQKSGEPVRLTREKDEFVSLDQRVGQSLEWAGAAFVSLHLNQVRSKKNRGITVYAYGRDRYRLKIPHRKHKVPPLPEPPKDETRASRELADSVLRGLKGQGFRVSTDRASYYVLKNPTIPSVLIELGFLSNPDDARDLLDPVYQDRLADALASSLKDYKVRATALASARPQRPLLP